MKIGMIFHSLNVPGGSASVFMSLALALQNAGHTVDVYCYYFDKENCFPELNRQVKVHYIKKIDSRSHRINNNSIFIRFLLGIDYYVNARKVYSLLKDNEYDLLYAAEASAYVPALMYKGKRHTKVFWSVFDPLSLVDNKRPGLITQKYKWFTYILRLHNMYDSRLIKRIDKVIVPTKKMKKQLDDFYSINSVVLPTAGVRSEEIKNNSSNIRLIEKRLKQKFNFVKEKQVILFSNGHFLRHRRYEDVLHALPSLLKNGYEIKYVISGSNKFDTTYYEKIASLVQGLGLSEHVILDTDFKTNSEILGYYQYSDIFLFVSVEQTWGLAPFEAMLCQKPVIISKGVGCSEVLTDKVNALIVDERSPKQITKSIELLITNKNLAKRISKGGHDTTIENFTYMRIAKKISDLVKQ